jgi:hypothetical protein
MSDVKSFARIRELLRSIEQRAGGDDEQLGLDEQGNLLIIPGGAAYDEITRAGRAFKAGTTTAVAAVVAIPTTAVGFAIYNNEPDGGRNYFIDRVWGQNVASTAVACQAQLLALVGQVREAAPTDAMPANSLISLSGLAGKDTKVRAILTATALPATTGLQGYWLPVGQNGTKPGVAGTPGYGMEALLQGRIVVPPGRYFAVHVLANVVGETFQLGIEWHEKLTTIN